MTDPLSPMGRRRGRPRKNPEDLARNHVSALTLEGPIPEWIGYTDLQALVRQYRGRFWDERRFKLWVEEGTFPSYTDQDCGTCTPGVRMRRYRWAEVKAWIDSRMVPCGPAGASTSGPAHPRRR